MLHVYRYLADLWPEGWLTPSILRRYRTACPQKRAEKIRELEELEAERHLVESVRAGAAAAAKVTYCGRILWLRDCISTFRHTSTCLWCLLYYHRVDESQFYVCATRNSENGCRRTNAQIISVSLVIDTGDIETRKEHQSIEGNLVPHALQWETRTDDYGRIFHANWETGETTYEPPLEMGYRPPIGRNELGHKVDPRLQALR